MSCLSACFEGVISMVQPVHVTSWNFSFPAHPPTDLIGKHMWKYGHIWQWEHNQTIKHVVCWRRGWQERNFINSEHAIRIDTDLCFFLMLILLMPYIVALFQPHSSWCFFSGWVVANNIRTDPYPRLEKHADDGHHRKSSVGDFGIELFGFLSRVRSGQHLESKVSSIRSTSWGLFLGDLAECHVGQDLTPSSMVGILSLWTTHINQQSNISYLVY